MNVKVTLCSKLPKSYILLCGLNSIRHISKSMLTNINCNRCEFMQYICVKNSKTLECYLFGIGIYLFLYAMCSIHTMLLFYVFAKLCWLEVLYITFLAKNDHSAWHLYNIFDTWRNVSSVLFVYYEVFSVEIFILKYQ